MGRDPVYFERGDLVRHKRIPDLGVGIVVSELHEVFKLIEWTEKITQPDIRVHWTRRSETYLEDCRHLEIVSKRNK